MSWRLLFVIVLLAASCAAPEPPEAWSVERVTPQDENIDDDLVCNEIRAFALGSTVADLDATIEELARLSAVAGATAALPLLDDIAETAADVTIPADRRVVVLNDLLVLASRSIDDATAATCGVPALSAMYAASGFASCHFELEIPIAAYTLLDPGAPCVADSGPTFLPCWSNDGNHLAVDCVTKELVQVQADRWIIAGEPREIAIDRSSVVEEEVEGPVTATGVPPCSALGRLFTDGNPPNGTTPDFAQLTAAAKTLSDEIQVLVVAFIAANTTPPDLETFEALVFELDAATANACGLPIVSAWVTLTAEVETLPCWIESGLVYPAYTLEPCV